LLQAYRAAGGSFASAVILLSSANAVGLSLMSGADGKPLFPNIQRDGGVIAGLPALASDSVGALLIAVDTSQLVVADELGLTVSRSTQATLELLDTPSSNTRTATATNMISLFQSNSVA